MSNLVVKQKHKNSATESEIRKKLCQYTTNFNMFKMKSTFNSCEKIQYHVPVVNRRWTSREKIMRSRKKLYELCWKCATSWCVLMMTNPILQYIWSDSLGFSSLSPPLIFMSEPPLLTPNYNNYNNSAFWLRLTVAQRWNETSKNKNWTKLERRSLVWFNVWLWFREMGLIVAANATKEKRDKKSVAVEIEKLSYNLNGMFLLADSCR